MDVDVHFVVGALLGEVGVVDVEVEELAGAGEVDEVVVRVDVAEDGVGVFDAGVGGVGVEVEGGGVDGGGVDEIIEVGVLGLGIDGGGVVGVVADDGKLRCGVRLGLVAVVD